MSSKRFTLNSEDIRKWLTDALYFLAPVGLLLIPMVEQNRPVEEMLLLLKMWGLGQLANILRKFVRGDK